MKKGLTEGGCESELGKERMRKGDWEKDIEKKVD